VPSSNAREVAVGDVARLDIPCGVEGAPTWARIDSRGAAPPIEDA
jgi:hypothetical protein